jgi:hypothetical protein
MSDRKRGRPRRSDPPLDPKRHKELEVDGLLSLSSFLAEPVLTAPEPGGATTQNRKSKPSPRHDPAEVAGRLAGRLRYPDEPGSQSISRMRGRLPDA